jgi:hypothetical protein
MNKRAWLKLLFDNRKTILSLSREGLGTWRRARKRQKTEAKLATRSERETAETGDA